MVIDNFKLVVNAHNDGWDQRKCRCACYSLLYGLSLTTSDANIAPDDKKGSPGLPGNSTCLTSFFARDCIICSIEKPCLYDLEQDLGEVHNLAESMQSKLKEMNDTYTTLVYNMRQVVPLNFTDDKGWTCDGKEDPGFASRADTCSCQSQPSSQCYRGHGHTIRILKGLNASSCCAACAQEPSCFTYSLSSRDYEKDCFLLDAGAKTSSGMNCSSGSCKPSPPAPSPSPPGCNGHW